MGKVIELKNFTISVIESELSLPPEGSNHGGIALCKKCGSRDAVTQCVNEHIVKVLCDCGQSEYLDEPKSIGLMVRVFGWAGVHLELTEK